LTAGLRRLLYTSFRIRARAKQIGFLGMALKPLDD
jgi:hypothetical protein